MKFGVYKRLIPSKCQPQFIPKHIPSNISKPDYSYLDDEMLQTIPILDDISQEKMRRAGRLAKKVLDYACSIATLGMTTDCLDSFVHDEILRNRAFPSPLGYRGFPKSICTSINNVIVHGIPDERPLEDGDIMNIDLTVYLDGWHGDTSRTIAIGNVDQEGCDLIAATQEALLVGINSVEIGAPFSEIGRNIERFAKSQGFSVNTSFVGHGIGQRFHIPPYILHHANDSSGLMEEGMAFTIEPILCQGKATHRTWPDRWTAVTRDGGRAAQFEHTILVSKDGAEILTI